MERNKTLDRAMEYSGAVGSELADILVSISLKVDLLTPQVPDQRMFSGDSLYQFIQDHQDCLEQLEDQLSNLITMTNCSVMDLHLMNEAYHWNLWRVEQLNLELLMRVTVLEGYQGDPIEIPNSPVPILIPPPGGNLLVEIVDGTDNEVMQTAVLRFQTSFSFIYD